MGLRLPGQRWFERLSKREQIIVGATVVVGVIAGWVLLHGWQQGRLRAVHAQLDRLQNQVKTTSAELPVKQREVERATEQQQADKEREAMVEKARQQLSGVGGIASLLTEIARSAGAARIQIVSIKPGELRDQGDYSELPITIEAISNFRDLAEYLQQLEHLSQLVVISKIKIETTAATSPVLKVGLETVSFIGKI